MDTKCKGLTARLPVKICCVILIPVMAFISLTGLVGLVRLERETDYFNEPLLFADFSTNDYFFDIRVNNALSTLEELFYYRSEENIRSMGCLEWRPGRNAPTYYRGRGMEEVEIIEEISEDRYELANPLSGRRYGDFVPPDELGGAYAKELERLAIEEQLLAFRLAQRQFKQERGLYYYISDGAWTMTNLTEWQDADFIRRQPVYFMLQKGESAIETSETGNPRVYAEEYGLSGESDTATIYVAYSSEIVDWQNAMWRYTQGQFTVQLTYMVIPICVAFILMLMLLAGAGRRVGEEKSRVFFTSFDKLWLDVGLVLLCAFEAAAVAFSVSFGGRMWTYGNLTGLVALCAVPAIVGTLPVVCWLTSLAKRVKAGKWWRYTMCHAVIRALWHGLKNFAASLWAGASLTARAVLIGAALWVSVMTLIVISYASENFGVGILFSLFFATGTVALMLHYAKKLYLLDEGAKAASAGDYATPIPVKGGELGSIASSINNISNGINAAVAEQLKSERLRTELITNVSHDIRTPLTSLITYTDLLKTEGLTGEKAPEYLEVLIQKSARLKTLTEDLFEATKAASGNVEVHLESLDLADLIRQVLGELDERVKASGLDFRLYLPEHAYVTADGRLLWRIVENLLSNVFKYALKASRVYVGITRENGSWALEIKNISEHELNVDPAELTERFKRGDDSRGGDGSGLGLSIAQSFTQAQGGQFTISIDGDLFKATVKLPSV